MTHSLWVVVNTPFHIWYYSPLPQDMWPHPIYSLVVLMEWSSIKLQSSPISSDSSPPSYQEISPYRSSSSRCHLVDPMASNHPVCYSSSVVNEMASQIHFITKYYCIDGLNFCIMTHQGRVPKALLPFLCPTGATVHQHELHICSVPESQQQAIFDTDATKFLIDSTASAHM